MQMPDFFQHHHSLPCDVQLLCCSHLCRTSQFCASPKQPGGVSGPRCRVQVRGPRWPSSHRTLEERRWWPAQRKVWLISWSTFITQYFAPSASAGLCVIRCWLLCVLSADAWSIEGVYVHSFCVTVLLWWHKHIYIFVQVRDSWGPHPQDPSSDLSWYRLLHLRGGELGGQGGGVGNAHRPR